MQRFITAIREGGEKSYRKYLDHLLREVLGRSLPAEAFLGRAIELIADLLQLAVGHPIDVTLAGQPSTDAQVGVADRALLPSVAQQGLAKELLERDENGSQNHIWVLASALGGVQVTNLVR